MPMLPKDSSKYLETVEHHGLQSCHLGDCLSALKVASISLQVPACFMFVATTVFELVHLAHSVVHCANP